MILPIALIRVGLRLYVGYFNGSEKNDGMTGLLLRPLPPPATPEFLYEVSESLWVRL